MEKYLERESRGQLIRYLLGDTEVVWEKNSGRYCKIVPTRIHI
jgi:hypothetical protein